MRELATRPKCENLNYKLKPKLNATRPILQLLHRGMPNTSAATERPVLQVRRSIVRKNATYCRRYLCRETLRLYTPLGHSLSRSPALLLSRAPALPRSFSLPLSLSPLLPQQCLRRTPWYWETKNFGSSFLFA
jgi:hypothetical protein